nr:unnamed protein product [Spirometra erinaceieuropaei]
MTRVLLQDCHFRLHKYRGVLSQSSSRCSEFVGENETALLGQVIGQRARELRSKRDRELMAKFHKLSSATQDDNDVLVHNLSSKEFKPEQIQVLRHAAGFNISDADPVNLVATIESVLKHSQEPAETQHLIRQQVTSLVMTHKPRLVIPRAQQDALRTLKADKSIVILPADKGRSTVILDKTEYLQKANTLLEDRQAYVKCDGDPMKKLMTQINTTLTMLQNNGAMSRAERLATKPTDAAMARFYGLPKIHKAGAPLRPIVSLRGTPTFNLAKWMFRRLNCLTSGSDTTVRSSVHFLERLKGLQIDTDEVMVSFDVTSLFTSIPKELAIETVSDLLDGQYTEANNTPKRGHLVQLLKYCLQTFFTFEGTVRDVGDRNIQTKVLGAVCGRHFRRSQTGNGTEFSRATELTMETENNNQIAFLDVLVHRKVNGSLKTTVYRKATNTRQVLSYHSNHPLCHKRSCVRSLYKRVDTHCSEPADKIAEFHNLRRIFTSNGYPRSFIERSRLSRATVKSTANQPKVWRALPYIANVSEAVARILQPLGIGIAQKPEATIRRMVMRPKTPLPRGETANVVYGIPCTSCEANYVGETGKRLQTRMDEHARAVRRMDQLSLVAEHCAAFDHAFAFQDAEVLGQGSDQTIRETLEAWHTTTTSINRCVILPAAYQVLRAKFNKQGYRRGVRPETAAVEPKPSGNTDGHRQESGTDETSGQPATNTNLGDRLLGPNTDRRQPLGRAPHSDRTPQPDVNTGMTTTINTVTDRCERGSEAGTHDSYRHPQPDVNTSMVTTVHTGTGVCEQGRKARCAEGRQRTMQTRAMAAAALMPLPFSHPTKNEVEPLPP